MSTWSAVHKWSVPTQDTEGNVHEVEYQEDVLTRRVRYVHLPSCWCKQKQD